MRRGLGGCASNAPLAASTADHFPARRSGDAIKRWSLHSYCSPRMRLSAGFWPWNELLNTGMPRSFIRRVSRATVSV